MKKYYAVTFKYDEDVFCSNIAHAETAEAVSAHYSKDYECVSVRECEDYEVESARRKGMPIVEVETPEPEAPTEGPEKSTNGQESIIARIIEYFKENEGVFNSCIEELDGYNGYLNDARYYPMEELNEFYSSNTEPLEILRRAFYGHDEDTYTTDGSGNKTYGEFNPNREFFYFNGYGNLVSSDYIDYSAYIDEYAVKAMSENRRYIDTIEEYYDLAALFDELEEADEED